MSNLPLIAVVGSTSKQGMSVATSLLESKKYHVKALTRKPDSLEAKRLKALGAEIFEADMFCREDLQRGFKGCHGVFSMTPPLPPDQTQLELSDGKMQADVAREMGVKHLVFSGLENADEISKGKYKVPHFSTKAKIEEYIRTLTGLTSSFVYLAYFYTNLIEYYPPARKEGTLLFSLPVPGDKEYPFVDPLTAPGPVVLEIFNNREKYSGKVVPVIGEEISLNRMMQTITKVTGMPAQFKTATKEEWFNRKMPPGFDADELWQMFHFGTEFGYFRPDRDLKESRRIDPNTRTYERFLRETRWQGEPYEEWKAKNLQVPQSK